MMTPPPSARAHTNRGLLFVVAALCVVLASVGVVVFRGLTQPPQSSAASQAGASANPRSASSPSSQAALENALKLQRSGEFAQAAALLKPIADRDIADQGVRVAYAQSLLGLKQYTEAYDQYQAALALDTGAKPGTSDPALAQLHFEAGTCASLAALPDRAIEHYSMAQSLDANEAKYPLYLGMMQTRAGDDAAAVASLVRSTRLKPDLAEGWGTLAEIELRRNNSRLAKQHIAEARKVQPTVTRWRLVEARALNRTGDADKAIELLSGLDASDRSDKAVLALKAESFGLLKRAPEAADMYVTAADAFPSDSELNYQAAIWLERTSQPEKAQKYANLAATLGHPQAKAMLTQVP